MISISYIGEVPFNILSLIISYMCIGSGIMIAYPIRWFQRSDIDDSSFINTGAFLMGCGAGVGFVAIYGILGYGFV